MRAVVQRVSYARVKVDGEVVGEIGLGFAVLLGAGREDDEADVDALARKVCGLRVFEDPAGLMNLSLADVDGEMLVVSQFTLFGDCRKGRRPSFIQALEPKRAAALVERFVARSREAGHQVATGRFQAMMDVELCNNGPVTLLLDSKKLF
ncbi:MAG: D-tyrosyl-tRNA(Tyr) deacylase [Deltaproteobacteria bacterium]|nr:D-tyrosyl-tRNA(Tyr) deacylase [Deltaproteobacteria bacterium]